MQNDLKFSGVNPVIINYNGSAEDIYAPVKTSSADVNIVSDQILDDLYTAKKDEVYMKVSKKSPVTERVIRFTSNGSAVSSQSSGSVSENHTIFSKNQFYTDKNGDYRFNGRIKDQYQTTQEVTLLYNPTTKKWERDNAWNMTYDEMYFWVDYNGIPVSYKMYSRNSTHYLRQWYAGNNDWGSEQVYYKFEDGTRSECSYWPKDAFHYINGSTELLWGKKRFEWSVSVTGWVGTTAYEDIDGGDYFAMYGEYYMKVKDSEGNLVDAIPIVGYSGNDTDVRCWIVRLNRQGNNFTRMIPVNIQHGSYSNVFADENGNVYYLTTDGEIYYWSWDIEAWVLWITFEGDKKSNSFSIDYQIPGTSNTVVIKYQNTSNQNQFFQLTNLVPPEVYYEEVVVPGQYTYSTIWEGYKMPNTYTQDVTQNLDTIEMTCIDPVSIMKYVKIDKILEKPSIKTYGQLIALALAYVKLDSNILRVERNVSYGSPIYSGSNGLLDLKCQVSNFWDESGEPSTIYEMIEELLRPFCMTLEYVDDKFQIYNPSKTEDESTFDIYTISDLGTLTHSDTSLEYNELYDFDNEDWKSNNISNAAIEIGSTYDKVTGTASTCIPEFSRMVFDVVDYNQTDKYDIFHMNVDRNKSKGYRRISLGNFTEDTSDVWYYIWNGVYVDELYQLESHGGYVNGYLNINKAYTYLTGNAGNPSDYGSILNFYGGADNPTGTGRVQAVEKPVEVHKRITAYAADNGTPLEFLENTDLLWSFSKPYDPESGYDTPSLSKASSSSAKFGTSIAMQDSNKVSYHQEYDMYLSSLEEHTIDLSLTQAYSRTGINTNIDIYQNNAATGKTFELTFDDDEQKWRATCSAISNVNYFPGLWDAASVKVNTVYFNRYNTSATLLRPTRLQPVWDKRRINMYIKMSDNTYYQYNGKEWVSGSSVSNSNSFYLMKMMNGENLYHTDFKYNIIETYDGEHYSLTDSRYTYYTDGAGGVTDRSVSGGTTHYCDVYNSESNSWYQYIDSCGEGSLSIKMPLLDDASAKIVVDVYNSTMLGMTGQSNTSGYNHVESIYYRIDGQGRYWDDDQQAYVYITLSDYNCVNYGQIGGDSTYINFIPVNASYVKAEHLDLNINVSVPESNLGQMFSQSDIKYTIDKKQNYVEEFEGPTFRTNTYNQLVSSSYSYIIFDNAIADPGNFVVNNISVRPECYTVQAYMNWLSVVRKVYEKTLVPLKDTTRTFSNFKTLITSPEVGENELLVISDSWDLKSNRHSIRAIEAHDLNVDYVSSFAVVEVPRKARAERWNLPTAVKK